MDELGEILKDLEKPIPEKKPLEIIVEQVVRDAEEKEAETIKIMKSRTDFERLLMVERKRWLQVVNVLVKAYTQKSDLRNQAKVNFRIDGKNFVVTRGNIYHDDQLLTADELINVTIVGKELDRLYESVSRYFQLEEVGALSDLRNAIVSLRSYQRRLERQGESIIRCFSEYRDQIRLLEQWKISNGNLVRQIVFNLTWWQNISITLMLCIFIYTFFVHWF